MYRKWYARSKKLKFKSRILSFINEHIFILRRDYTTAVLFWHAKFPLISNYDSLVTGRKLENQSVIDQKSRACNRCDIDKLVTWNIMLHYLRIFEIDDFMRANEKCVTSMSSTCPRPHIIVPGRWRCTNSEHFVTCCYRQRMTSDDWLRKSITLCELLEKKLVSEMARFVVSFSHYISMISACYVI